VCIPVAASGAASPACDAAGFSIGATRGSGAEHPRLSRTSPEFAGSVARTIAVARLVWPPELDLRAEHLALSGEALARENLRLRLKASTGQVFRILATEARSEIKGRHRPASMGEVWTSLHQPKVASNI